MYVTIAAPRTPSHGCITLHAQYRGAQVGSSIANDQTRRAELGIDRTAIHESAWGWTIKVPLTPAVAAAFGLGDESEIREQAISHYKGEAEQHWREAAKLRNEVEDAQHRVKYPHPDDPGGRAFALLASALYDRGALGAYSDGGLARQAHELLTLAGLGRRANHDGSWGPSE